jgi:hypothetical protein
MTSPSQLDSGRKGAGPRARELLGQSSLIQPSHGVQEAAVWATTSSGAGGASNGATKR